MKTISGIEVPPSTEQSPCVIPKIERSWFLVDVKTPNECWPWRGSVNNSGYGSSHRRLYELCYGRLEKGLVVMHLCHNRSCCNPLHLAAGTQTENLLMSKRDGRMDESKRSCSVRASRRGTGVQYDKRAECFYVMFKVFGKPLYLGTYKNEALARALAEAALDSVDKLMRTRQQISYAQIKEYFYAAS